MKYKIMKKILK